MCETLEQSDHTSVQRRIEVLQEDQTSDQPGAQSTQEDTRQKAHCDDFLSPLSIDESRDPLGPDESRLAQRYSDKGFLAMPLQDYERFAGSGLVLGVEPQ